MHAARVGVICKTSQAVNQASHDNTAQAHAVALHELCCENCWKADRCSISEADGFQRGLSGMA